MKKFFAILTALILLFGAYMGFKSGYKLNRSNPVSKTSTPDQSVTANENIVVINNFSFNPSVLTVDKGAKVTFRNDDSAAHTVTADDGKFDTKNINPGGSSMLTFKQSGTYSYHCSLHSQMKGKIVVK